MAILARELLMILPKTEAKNFNLKPYVRFPVKDPNHSNYTDKTTCYQKGYRLVENSTG